MSESEESDGDVDEHADDSELYDGEGSQCSDSIQDGEYEEGENGDDGEDASEDENKGEE